MMTSIMGGQSNQWWRCLIWLTSIDIKSKFNQQSSWVAASFCLRQKLDMVGNDRYLTNKHELILLITIDIWSLFDQQSWCGCCIILPKKILILMLMMISLRSIDIMSLFDQQSSWIVALFCSPKRLSLLSQSAIATSPPHNPTELLQLSVLYVSFCICTCISFTFVFVFSCYSQQQQTPSPQSDWTPSTIFSVSFIDYYLVMQCVFWIIFHIIW